MYTSTARRYKCNISERIALLTGNILTELFSFHYILDSPQTVLVFTNIYKDICIRVSKLMLKMLSASCCSNVVHIFDGFAYIFKTITISLI